MDVNYHTETDSRKMFVPNIAASKVAGLIGLNPYQNKNEIMFDLMMKDPSLKVKLNEIIATNSRKSLAKFKREILDDKDVSAIIGTAVRQTTGVANIKPILDGAERSARSLLGLRYSDMDSNVRNIIADEVRSAVRCRRGLASENTGLDNYAAANEVVVGDRNTKTFKKSYGSFELNGRPDGFVMSLNRIVDTKERTRWSPNVPIYDEVQLRVYMDLTGAQDSDLNEVFPDGRRRQTNYKNDAEKWQTIVTGLEYAVLTMNEILEDPDLLRDLVFANSV
jgi:hypothetical protein